VYEWEFVHAPSGARENWRWRKKEPGRNVLLESARFAFFLHCLADARHHGFDMSSHAFDFIQE
jgi:hypothetical protein